MADFVIKQGTDSGIVWPVFNSDGTAKDLTGWTVRAQARRWPDSETTQAEWSSADGTAFVVTNKVTLVWDAATTASWSWNKGVYDVEVVSPEGTVARIASGTVRLSKEVTR